MTDDERAIVSRTVGPEELDLLLKLETARAMYLAAEDCDAGSITEAKVARYPERYRESDGKGTGADEKSNG